jgi:hypothetical protein
MFNNLSVHLSVCSSCFFVCLLAYLYISPLVCLIVYSSIWPAVHLSIYPLSQLTICSTVYLSICLRVFLVCFLSVSQLVYILVNLNYYLPVHVLCIRLSVLVPTYPQLIICSSVYNLFICLYVLLLLVCHSA